VGVKIELIKGGDEDSAILKYKNKPLNTKIIILITLSAYLCKKLKFGLI